MMCMAAFGTCSQTAASFLAAADVIMTMRTHVFFILQVHYPFWSKPPDWRILSIRRAAPLCIGHYPFWSKPAPDWHTHYTYTCI